MLLFQHVAGNRLQTKIKSFEDAEFYNWCYNLSSIYIQIDYK